MKKFFALLMMIALVFAVSFQAEAATQYYRAEVYKLVNTGDVADSNTRITSGITYKVLATDSDTAETLWSDTARTSKTNPITTTVYNTQDRVDFYCDPTDSGDLQVDIIVVDTNGGFTAFVEDFTPYDHKIIIDERPNVVHQGSIWFSASSDVETDTGIDFLYDTMVLDVRVETVTVDAGETLDVGLLSTETSGDADGFIDLRSVAVEGLTADTGVITGGSTIDYVPDSTYGDLLYTIIAGSDAVATVGGRSYLGHFVTGANAKSLTYTGSSGSDTAAGYIHYWFNRVR